MYTVINFKTKKALKEAIANNVKVRIYQPGGMFNPPEAGEHYTGGATVKGPHYPTPHSWYAKVELVDGVVMKVK